MTGFFYIKFSTIFFKEEYEILGDIIKEHN